ncbi:zinc-binding dehydrogenase [Streptomyces thioluteus]|uniref:Zinc-binding dehydrogenase n=1 Tax=Streptomyces thioluteus TaxID=66431 RepID=A0ABN3WAC2_STRTU
MLAVVAKGTDPAEPLGGLYVGEWPEAAVRGEWTTVTVHAASLNHHDLWTLRGVGPGTRRVPVVLGSDAAGVDEDGNEVIIHPVVGDPAAGGGDETLDPGRTLFGEEHDGTCAQRVAVPVRNLVPKPPGLSFEEAACLPGAWLTAYRMLFRKAALRPGDTVLVQGAGGGVSTALITLGAAAGFRVWVTGRSEERRESALRIGAHDVFSAGARLPARVDAVMETVGEATWAHSLRSLRPGGRVVVSGGDNRNHAAGRPGPYLLPAVDDRRIHPGHTRRPTGTLPVLRRAPAVSGHRPGAAAGTGPEWLPSAAER